MCVGLNYKKHALETGHPAPLHPVVFYKNPSAVSGPFDSIVIPKICKPDTEVDYECELAVVMGPRPCRNVSKEEALEYVLGYTSANDVSARRWQGKKGGGQWR
jgi:2-keto-4-pentenoate hydratase/2-oxohepta-3-ene-1,7-dioic acid hydratase in catechol pathway